MRRGDFFLGMAALAVTGLVACGGVGIELPLNPLSDAGLDSSADDGGPDGGDATSAEATTDDAPSADTSTDDAPSADARMNDAASPDEASDDATTPDASAPDAAYADATSDDATTPDATTDARPPEDGGDASVAYDAADAEGHDAADASDAESADAADGGGPLDAADASAPADMTAFVGRWSPSTGSGQADCGGVISNLPPNPAAILTFTEDSPDALAATSSGAGGCVLALVVSGETASLARSSEACGTVAFTTFNLVFIPAAGAAGGPDGGGDASASDDAGDGGAPPQGTLDWQLVDTEGDCVTTLDYTLVRTE